MYTKWLQILLLNKNKLQNLRNENVMQITITSKVLLLAFI